MTREQRRQISTVVRYVLLIAVGIIMILIYSLLDNTLIFAEDPQYMKLGNNQKIIYM